MIQPFLTTAIFDNYGANNFCDHLVSLIAQEGESFPSDFALSGRAAYELQRFTNEPCQNFVFVTWNLEHYIKIANELVKFNVKELIKYKELLKFKYKSGSRDLCFEIYFEEKEQPITYYKDIALISLSSIPNTLL